MDLNLCRLCLVKVNLSPIFVNTEESDRYSIVLALTTGLKIEIDDGLPQKICLKCTKLVNLALKLRNVSHLSEINLLKQGFIQNYIQNDENQQEIGEIIEESEANEENFLKNNDDCFDFDGFKIEVELDRLSEIEQDGVIEEPKESSIQPEYKKEELKDKRAMYLDLVEGSYEGNGPIKCRICKQVLSKWACFTNHVRKHLGYKFICEYCGKSFLSSTHLKRHAMSCHGVARDIQCSYCDFRALDNAQLKIHTRRSHTGERPFVCDICAASYHSRKCLLQHIEGHRSEATVQCNLCPQLFKSQRHLSKHRYSAHSDRRRRNKKKLATEECD